MLKERLSSRTKQRLIFAAREMDRSVRESDDLIRAELADLEDPGVTSVELLTGLICTIGHKIMRFPAAFVAGGEEYFRRR